MRPLQKIAMGLLITLIPAAFPAHPHPAWAVYQLIPPVFGWALAVSGVGALRRSGFDVGATLRLGWLALAVSIPMWFPQLNHYLVPAYNHGVSHVWQWVVALPAWVFCFALAQRLSTTAKEAKDRSVAAWFGMITWAFVGVIIVPGIVYGAPLPRYETTMGVFIGLVNVAFIVAMFSYNRRLFFGGEAKEAAPRRERPLSK